MSEVKRWCGQYAAGTESARACVLVEWYPDGGDDQDTAYVLASDYDALAAQLKEALELLIEMQGWASKEFSYIAWNEKVKALLAKVPR